MFGLGALTSLPSSTWKALLGVAASLVTVHILRVRFQHRPHLRPNMSEISLRVLRKGRRHLLKRLFDVGGFFGLDIGGSLAKLVFFQPDAQVVERLIKRSRDSSSQLLLQEKNASVQKVAQFLLSREKYGRTGIRDGFLTFRVPELAGSFHFVRFETRRMLGALQLARTQGLNTHMHSICATGGGAIRFRERALDILGVDLLPVDEIDCLVKGMGFLMDNVEGEAYTFHGT